MAESVEEITVNSTPEQKTATLVRRRCILLAVIGSTQPDSAPLKVILNNGYLVLVKKWLDDILNGDVGKVDLLLHLLDHIYKLPVTKDMVTTSKLGKAVSAVEKHKICVGTLNESAIKERVTNVKQEWSASVKRMKQKMENGGTTPKRSLDSSDGAPSPSPKKAKVEESPGKKDSAFSSLIKKVAVPSSPISAAEAARLRAQERDAKLIAKLAPVANTEVSSTDSSSTKDINSEESPSKKEKHIKWADTTGGNLERALSGSPVEPAPETDKSVKAASWSDNKKRDRLREKELLQQARKSKIVDTDDDDLGAMVMMNTSWHKPHPLPPDKEAPPQLVSRELGVQVTRMASLLPANYLSEEDVPENPTPLSDIEQALEIASQSSAPALIPFFVPQQVPAPIVPVPLPAPLLGVPSAHVPAVPRMPPPPPVPPTGASAELVQAMGLPFFLVGSNVQALQTLAATPNLMNTFIDANGMYDQQRLMNLVNTLAQNLAPSQQTNQMGTAAFQPQGGYLPPPPPFGSTPQSGYHAPPQSHYGNASATPDTQLRAGYRGDQNQSEGNLHVSGYGPGTTQAEIVALFSPYVQIQEVVPKNGFSFINTNDPMGARRAREILSGAILGGNPIRINIAQRRAKDSFSSDNKAVKKMPPRSEPMPLPVNHMGQVRDDRGNPATKNLFVAGYGNGTTEQNLQTLISQYAAVTGVVIKGTFSFVNTSDKIAAIHAREALSGTVLNGGVLRINFAKESGRLGTSFDQTYGPGGSSQQSHGNGSQQSHGNGSQQSHGNGSQQSHGNGSQQRYMRPPY
eukprot:scaffold26379_cov52-Attheya_sp.AAC.2